MRICSSAISAGACPQSGTSTARTRPCLAAMPRRCISRTVRGMQQVGILAAQDQHGARHLLPHAPQRDVDHQRPRELRARWRDRSAGAVAVLCPHHAVLGHVPPLRVGELAERRVDLAQVRFDLRERREGCARAQVGADALQARRRRRARRSRSAPGGGSASPRSAAISMPTWPPSEVPIQSTSRTPSARDERRHRGEIERRGVVLGVRQDHSLRPRPGRSGATTRMPRSARRRARKSKSRLLRVSPCTHTTTCAASCGPHSV